MAFKDIDIYDAEPITQDTLNKIGLDELGKRVQAMTEDEQWTVVSNLPVNICIRRIQSELDRLTEIESGVAAIVKRFEK